MIRKEGYYITITRQQASNEERMQASQGGGRVTCSQVFGPRAELSATPHNTSNAEH